MTGKHSQPLLVSSIKDIHKSISVCAMHKCSAHESFYMRVLQANYDEKYHKVKIVRKSKYSEQAFQIVR